MFQGPATGLLPRTNHNTLQQPATPCNTLQTHCNTLQYIVFFRAKLPAYNRPPTATHQNTMQHTATHCNTLQHKDVSGLNYRHTAAHQPKHPLQLPTLPLRPWTTVFLVIQSVRPQHTAIHCNTHTATQCNTLQHNPTHCKTHKPLTPRDISEKSVLQSFCMVHRQEASWIRGFNPSTPLYLICTNSELKYIFDFYHN